MPTPQSGSIFSPVSADPHVLAFLTSGTILFATASPLLRLPSLSSGNLEHLLYLHAPHRSKRLRLAGYLLIGVQCNRLLKHTANHLCSSLTHRSRFAHNKPNHKPMLRAIVPHVKVLGVLLSSLVLGQRALHA
jgi:hypothetical protein